jgi:hypothetical protein
MMYAEGDASEKVLIADLGEMPFDRKSFLDEGFLSDRDGLPLGSRIAICPEINPEKKTNKYAIDLLVSFYEEQKDGTWKKLKTSLGDLKVRKDPLLTAEKRYSFACKQNSKIIPFPWYEIAGLDFGNEKFGREYAKYLPIAEKGDDVYLLYAVNYEGTRWLNGQCYKFPYANQNLWLTSTLRVREAELAGLLLVTDYSGMRFQLPFPLKLPSGKPLFQKVISNYILEIK